MDSSSGSSAPGGDADGETVEVTGSTPEPSPASDDVAADGATGPRPEREPSGEGGADAPDPGGGSPDGPAPADVDAVDVESLVEGGPILLFDGVCNLCNGAIRFVIRNDPDGLFRFAPLQSAAGRALLEYADVDVDPMESFVMIDGDRAHVRSGAALRVAGRLGLPWSLARPFLYVPRVIRDGVYDLVATYRYRVFGRKDRCMVPDEDVSDRFLD